MKPEARCGGSLVVAGFVEACGEEVIGELASLGKAVNTFANFERDPEIAGFFRERLYYWINLSGISARRTRVYS